MSMLILYIISVVLCLVFSFAVMFLNRSFFNILNIIWIFFISTVPVVNIIVAFIHSHAMFWLLENKKPTRFYKIVEENGEKVLKECDKEGNIL